MLLNGGLIFGLCYISAIIGKCIVANIISHSKDMTDDTAKFLTEMMSKDININLPN